MTKYIICLGDGMADHPVDALDGKTPVEQAYCPNMDFISENGQLGMVDTVPEGFLPGSDVANMGVLGYDPADYYTGRGPIEAASMGIECAENEMIFRCNLVHIESNTMIDFTSEHISSEESAVLIDELNAAFSGKGVRFVAGVGYRHIMLADQRYSQLSSTAPHDITDKEITDYLPAGPEQESFAEIIKEANAVLAQSAINQKRREAGKRTASSIWPWSQGKYPVMPDFKEKYGHSGGIITAVDLLKGLGKLVNLETPDIEGATGFVDTNYANKVAGALKILENHDFCYLHIEAPDEAGHMGDVALKTKAIEDFDKQVVGPILEYQKANPDTVVMVLPDHPTPCHLKTHTHEPVPFAIYTSGIPCPSGKPYAERTGRDAELHFTTPWDLLTHFFSLG